jgi:two-component system, sensor histidine kinase RegB
LRWIVRLRWWAVLGQAITIALATFVLRLSLPVLPVTTVVVITALSNAGLSRWMRAPRDVSARFVAGVLALDTLLLFVLLRFSGGPSNPFSVLYLVQITLAALVLGAWYATAIVALSTVSYAVLFFDNVPLAGMEHMHHAGTGAFTLHLEGMFAAFTLAAVLIAYFVTRVSTALRERDLQLADAQRLALANEKLASLSTLAAGAAHELGTPLATIAVAAKELELAARILSGAGAIVDDARLIRQQVDRCHDIVRQMSAHAGDPIGEAPETVPVEAIVSELRRRLGQERAARLEVRVESVRNVTLPWRGVVQTLGSLVKNAFEASSGADHSVVVSIEQKAGRTRIAVVDHGAGIPRELLARVGEPFFTTKTPGAGMGLGVFLAKAFVDRLGGTLTIESAVGRGTEVTLAIPRLEA